MNIDKMRSYESHIAELREQLAAKDAEIARLEAKLQNILHICEVQRVALGRTPATKRGTSGLGSTGKGSEDQAVLSLTAPGLLAAAEHIESTWGRAYPETVEMFRELPLGADGVSDDARTRISAGMGRHIVKCVCRELRCMANERDAEEALAATPPAKEEK